MGKKKFKLRLRKRKPRVHIRLSTAAPPPWIELPTDVTANILQRLCAFDLLENAQYVCTTWHTVCREPATWRVIDMRNLGEFRDMPYNHGDNDEDCQTLEIMCRHAVDRSQGQLIDINIFFFATDELLRYISERSSQLRCLRLACCYDVSGKVLREAVAKLPDLEELHLFFMPYIQPGDIESIGHSCPKLNSFTLNGKWYSSLPEENNDYALAVAESMHDLRHLKLFANEMSNDGLQAVLDNCPYLESLDVRGCFNVILEGDLSERCSQQIKDLLRPYDSIDDYEWESKINDDEESSYGDFSEYSDNCSVDDDDYFDPFCSWLPGD